MPTADEHLRQQAETLFQAVCDRPADEQETYLRGRSDVAAAVRDEVARLLQIHRDPDPPTLRGPLGSSGEDDLVGTDVGRYRLLERIGEGGFGVVYMASSGSPSAVAWRSS